MKAFVGADELARGMDTSDTCPLMSKIEEAIQRLDENHNADKEEFEEKQSALEAVTNSIFKKLGGADSFGMPGTGGTACMSAG